MLRDNTRDVATGLLHRARRFAHDTAISGTVDQPVTTPGKQASELPRLRHERGVIASSRTAEDADG